jgi:two-component system, NarL family, sensor kinase
MPNTGASTIVFLIFMIIFIIVMITFIIIILFFIQKKQKGFTHDLMAVKANYEKELYKAQLEIQEQTFQEIAREIHDNVGQILSLAKLGLGTLDLDRKEEAKESIVEISDILEKALDDLRHMSRTMNAEIIKKGGLKKSIEMQVGFLQRGGKFNIHFNVQGEPFRLDETKEIILFRILQEAVNNIIRHSTATDICISLSYNKDFLRLQIQDNGKGFSLQEQVSGSNHISGIYNMQHRAKLIEAEFEMDSKIGIGTKISVTTPN